jgi:hypothetical protein
MSEVSSTEQKKVPRWTDRSDRTWPVEVVPAWAYDAAEKKIERLRDALAAIAAPGPLEQCPWQTDCARKALEATR